MLVCFVFWVNERYAAPIFISERVIIIIISGQISDDSGILIHHELAYPFGDVLSVAGRSSHEIQDQCETGVEAGERPKNGKRLDKK